MPVLVGIAGPGCSGSMSKLNLGRPCEVSLIGVGNPTGAGAGALEKVLVVLGTGEGAWTEVWSASVVTAGAVVVGLSAEVGDLDREEEDCARGGLGVGGLGDAGTAVGDVRGTRLDVDGENETFLSELAVLADLDRFPEILLKILDAVEPLFLCSGWNDASEARRDDDPELD